MKTLNKEMLTNRLKLEVGVLEKINKEIEESKITNQAHKLYTWKYMTIGAINMLQSLIEEQL
nr:MAG: hypothetical protein [Microvirus sp.]